MEINPSGVQVSARTVFLRELEAASDKRSKG